MDGVMIQRNGSLWRDSDSGETRSEERRVGSDWSSDVCSSDLVNRHGARMSRKARLRMVDGWGHDTTQRLLVERFGFRGDRFPPGGYSGRGSDRASRCILQSTKAIIHEF